MFEVATLSLCLLCGCYAHALDLIRLIGDQVSHSYGKKQCCGSGSSFLPQCGSGAREPNSSMRIRILVRFCRHNKLNSCIKNKFYVGIGS
jgi:hypothetical protein